MTSEKLPQPKSLKEIRDKLSTFQEMWDHVVVIDRSNSDWSNVLILTTLLDQVLELALRQVLQGDDELKQELFKGMLRDLSRKIQLGYALGLYSEPAYKGMDIVREIRNLFAHTRHDLSFQNQAIASKVRDLTDAIWKGHQFKKENAAQDFVHATGTLLFYLDPAKVKQRITQHLQTIIASTTSTSTVTPPPVTLSEPEVTWAKAVRDRLNHICALPAGWDGYRGVPTRFDVAEFATQLLRRICKPHTPAPAIVPLPSGGLQIEWHTDNAMIELAVRAPYQVEGWVADPRTGNDGMELALTTDFTFVVPWVHRMGGAIADQTAA